MCSYTLWSKFFEEGGLCLLGRDRNGISEPVCHPSWLHHTAISLLGIWFVKNLFSRNIFTIDSYIQTAKKKHTDKGRSAIAAVNNELQDVTRIMVSNIEDVIHRGEALNSKFLILKKICFFSSGIQSIGSFPPQQEVSRGRSSTESTDCRVQTVCWDWNCEHSLPHIPICILLNWIIPPKRWLNYSRCCLAFCVIKNEFLF